MRWPLEEPRIYIVLVNFILRCDLNPFSNFFTFCVAVNTRKVRGTNGEKNECSVASALGFLACTTDGTKLLYIYL